MSKKIVIIGLISLLAGCASVPMQNSAISNQAKAFNKPSMGNAGIYVYRDAMVGQALKKDVWIDGECLGETARNVFFYKEVVGNQRHTLTTESEFGTRELQLDTKAGENYFVEQKITMGLLSGGARLQLVEPSKGMRDVAKLNMAQTGRCSRPLRK